MLNFLHFGSWDFAIRQTARGQNRLEGFVQLKLLLQLRSAEVVEPLLSGIVLGLVVVTLAGLFVAAYLQYRRGSELGG